MDRSPGGIGDGLASLPSGEPVLPRWFAIIMVILVPLGIAITAWAFLSIESEDISPAARRPPGTAEITHERGGAALNEIVDTEDGPGCTAGMTLVGDIGARAALRRALSTVCGLIARDELGLDLTAAGVDAAVREGIRVRMAVFELTGVDASSRVEDGTIVMELNAKFQFRDASSAAPILASELAHFAQGFPGRAVSAQSQLAALLEQRIACKNLTARGDLPRGCLDVEQLMLDPDPLAALIAAGFDDEESR